MSFKDVLLIAWFSVAALMGVIVHHIATDIHAWVTRLP